MEASQLTGLHRFRRQWFRNWPRHAIYSLSERYYEYRLGIVSSRFIKLSELGIDDSLCGNYAPVKYRTFFKMMNSIEIGEHDVFLDYGSGMGRAVIAAAATYPLKRAIGIDISPELTRFAMHNLKNARERLQCNNVEFLTTDATSYVPSADVTIVFFNNPFKGSVLSAVVDNIHSSLVRQPRRLTIIYVNPRNYKTADADFEQYAKQSPWLVKTKEFSFYPPAEGCIYETTEVAPVSWTVK